MTKFENTNFVELTDQEMMETEGGFGLTATGIIGGTLVLGFGGLGLYLGLK